MKALQQLLTAFFTVIALNANCFAQSSSENERLTEYHETGNSWPPRPDEYTPSTPGWQKLNRRRFEQFKGVGGDDDEVYNMYMLTIHSALLSQNFTEFGWGLTKAPKAIVDKLKKQLHAGLKIMEEKEKNDPRKPHERESFFIPNDEINNDIVHELLPLHEAWSGVELVPQNTYGLRVYRGDTNLNMHVDITETHVISSILHVDHSDDEPWPIVIEDFHGNTNEVFLESGDMLFYESSKCMHGRPSKFNGAYYSSVFTHYYPVGWNDDGQLYNNLYARIPKSWNDRSKKTKNATEHGITDGSSIVEPECEHEWCALRESLKWHGPAPGYGKVLSGDGKVTNLMNIPSERSFDRKKSMNPGTSAEVYVQGSDDF